MNGTKEVMAEAEDSAPPPGGEQDDIKIRDISAIKVVFNLAFPPNLSFLNKKY